MADELMAGETAPRPGDRRAVGTGWRRRIWRRAAAVLLGVAALIALGVAVLDSPIGHRLIVRSIASYAPASGLRIDIGRIEGALYREAVLHDVVLSDPRGAFLRVPEVELDWRPLAWLTRGLDVRRLVARRGALLRLPELRPGDPDAPILPGFDIRVDRFELDRMMIHEDVAGIGRQIDLLASVDVHSGRARIDLASDLGGEDRLMARLDAAPDRDRFDLALDYRAPAGGLLAGMVGAERDVRARVVGEGGWSAWRGALLIEEGGERFAALRLTNRAGLYNLSGQVYPGDRLPGFPAAVVGRAMSVALSARLENRILEGRMDLGGGAFRASAEGAVDLAGNRVDRLDVGLRLTDPALFGRDVRIAGLAARVTLDGRFNDLSARYDLAADRARIGTVALAGLGAQGTARWDGGRLMLPLTLDARRVMTGEAMLDARLVQASLRGTIIYAENAIRSDDLRLAGRGIDARIVLRSDLRTGVIALAGPVRARGLALGNIGAADAEAQLVVTLGGRRGWALRGDLSGRLPHVSNATIANLAGSSLRFEAKLTAGARQPLVLENGRIAGERLTLALSGRRRSDGTVLLTGAGRQSRFGRFAGDVAIDRAGPQAELVFASPFPAAGLRDVRLALSPGADGFAVATSGESLLGAFTGAIRLAMPAGGPARIEVERLAFSSTAITGALLVDGNGIAGELAMAGGGMDGIIGLDPSDRGQLFSADLTARRARFAGATGIEIAAARLRASGLLADESTSVDAQMKVQGLSYGGLFIGNLAAEAKLENGAGSFIADVSGRRGSRFDLRAVGELAPDRITFGMRGSLAGRPVAMPRRAVLVKHDQSWRLRPTQLDFAGGTIVASGQLGSDMALDVGLSRIPLSLADLAIPELGLGGTASGEITYRDEGGVLPTGRARLLLSGLSRSGLVLTSRPIDAALVAELTASELQARAVIGEGGESRGRLQARITGLPETGALGERLRRGSLAAEAHYDGPSDALWRLAGVEAFDLTGSVAIAARVRGTLDQPRLRGSLRSETLRLQSPLTGADIRDIAASGSFTGSQLRLASLAGRAANGGTVRGSGAIDLSRLASGGVGIDLRLAAEAAQLVDREDMAAVVSGPLRIVSSGRGGTIAGRLEIVSARWRLGNAAASQALAQIATREINLPADQQPLRAAGRAWRFLIDAHGNNRVVVRGLGLDSEWSANLRLRGTTDAMRILGEAELVRGEYEFAGTSFELERGRIRFAGDTPPDPQLDLLAGADVDDIDARIAITGTAQAPQVAFSSIPALPEEEVLARLLFGDSIARISAPEALQLGVAVASLQSGDGGLDPINELRSAIGLDRLRVVGADEARGRGTSVAVGKNLGRKLYVELITDGRGYSATELEFRVTRWLSLLGSISSLGYNSLEAEVSRDY